MTLTTLSLGISLGLVFILVKGFLLAIGISFGIFFLWSSSSLAGFFCYHLLFNNLISSLFFTCILLRSFFSRCFGILRFSSLFGGLRGLSLSRSFGFSLCQDRKKVG